MDKLERIIDAVDAPATTASLCDDLGALGVERGDVVLVHSSLSSLGFVVGGAVAVVEALMQAVGPEGTIVMPTHTSDNSDPNMWQNPAVPKAWWPIVREHLPAFDPDTTPSWHMGAIPEVFRTYRGTRRSYHPTDSFAAWGAERDAIVGEHELDFGLGDGGPLGRLYEQRGKVLLLGVGHDRNTSLHLAEYRWGGGDIYERHGAVRGEAGRAWVSWSDFELDSDDFARCGRAFEKASTSVRVGAVAAAEARCMPQAELVDFAVGWFTRNRRAED